METKNKKTKMNLYKYLGMGIFIFVLFFSVSHIIFGNNYIQMSASETSINSGDPVTITWTTTNNAGYECAFYVGSQITPQPVSFMGAIIEHPTETTSYTVGCFFGTGVSAVWKEESVAVSVIGSTPFPTTGFGIDASSTLIMPNSTSTIYWRAQGATSCKINGDTPPASPFTTPPLVQDTTYTLDCWFPGYGNSPGEQTASVAVNVIGMPTVAVPPANPWSIDPNKTSTITWSSTGAEACSSPDISTLSGTYGSVVVSPIFTTTYHINCTHQTTDANGAPITLTAMGSAIVIVSKLPPAVITGIYTEDPTDMTSDGANLWGKMNPAGNGGIYGTASAYFRYSTVSPQAVTPIFCDDIYGSNMKSTREVMVSGNTSQEVNTTLTGLVPNTTYYYCVVGSSATGQIAYGGVKSFTTHTLIPAVTTEAALVVGKTSAYLNGTYNATDSANTWFEYSEKIFSSQNQQISSSAPKNFLALVKDIWANFIGTKSAMAAASTSTKVTKSGWIRVDEQSHDANTNGNLSYLLTGLAPGTYYEFRAGIETNSTSGTPYTTYGETLYFITQGSTGINPGGGGAPYVNPCTDPTDPNCNGTGGPGNYKGGNTYLPDLIAGPVSPTSSIVNMSTTFSALITNQGNGSTIPSTPIAPGGTAVSFLDNFFKTFKTNEALAAASTATNQTNVFTKGSFYNFFQISTVNPTPANNNQNIAPGGTAVSALHNFLKIPKALASGPAATTTTTTGGTTTTTTTTTGGSTTSVTTGGATVNNTLINLPPILTGPLGPRSSVTITQDFAFNSVGTYYVRACTDKSSPTDLGLIKESYEDNNCGPWTAISAINQSQACTDPNAINYGGLLPCQENIGPAVQLCQDTTALNFGSPTPCTYPAGVCTDPSAANYGGALPCTGSSGTGGTSTSGVATNPSNLALGDTATPPDLALVHYHEGIETVFQRQIVANSDLATSYGYQQDADLQSFAWTLADILAKSFGYVSPSGEEIRVGPPDMAAYQLYVNNGVLTVYEYYNSKIVNIEKMTDALRGKYGYEYYYHK